MSPLCSTSLRSLHTSRTRWRRLEVAQIRTFSGGASAPPLHDGLQIFIGGLVFLKGKIIQKQEEAVVAALHLPQNVGDQVILLLVKLNEPQSLIGVLVDKGLNAGGFSGTGVTVEQHIVAALPPAERLPYCGSADPLLSVAHQIRQTYRRTVLHGDQLRAVPCPSGPEHLPHAQQTDALSLIERRQAAQQPSGEPAAASSPLNARNEAQSAVWRLSWRKSRSSGHAPPSGGALTSSKRASYLPAPALPACPVRRNAAPMRGRKGFHLTPAPGRCSSATGRPASRFPRPAPPAPLSGHADGFLRRHKPPEKAVRLLPEQNQTV